MCHFITLIVPTDDRAAVKAVMERHGRAAEAIDNLSIRKLLGSGERQYVTTRGHCDCGTVLAPRHIESAEAFEEKLARHASRLARKGWSEAKIKRAIEDRRKAGGHPDGGGHDSIELWVSVLNDLKVELRLPYVGLLVRFYSGAIASEAFKATRRDARKDVTLSEALASMAHDEVTIFSPA